MNFPSKSDLSVSPTYKKTKHDIENHVTSEIETNTCVKTMQDICLKSQEDEHNTGNLKNLGSEKCSNVSNNFQNDSPGKCVNLSHQFVRTPTSKKSSELSVSSGRKRTPQGLKRGTPKKIFEKSPRKLEEFNVQILEDFVQISPSTSNKIVKQKTTSNKFCGVVYDTTTSSNRHTLEQKNTPSNKSPKYMSETVLPGDGEKFKFSEVSSKYRLEQSHFTQVMAQSGEDATEDLKEALNTMFCEEFNVVMDKFNNINFTESQQCTILEVRRISATKTSLKLKSSNGDVGFCSIEEFWSSSSNFQVGDTVTVNGIRNSNGNWVVNNQAGWLIYEPDLLISCTSVVGSLFCKRKSVLSERFRGFEPGSRVMLVGIWIHTLLENVLKQKLKTKDEIEAALKRILKSKDTIKRLYECNLNFDDVEPELLSFVPKILDFVNQYVYDKCSTAQSSQNWRGKICDIDDIEENIMCPELGIKGKIDVTIKTETNTMPLELKTGRATVSLEHRAQVMLYIMMMNKFGYRISSGLLLYLREGVLKEIKATPQEQRDIIILRNELAYYLARNTPNDNNDEGLIKLPQLPEPINHHSACAKCSYNVICTSFLKFTNYDLSKNSALQKVQNNVTAHLTEAHLSYFIHWYTLLSLEAEHTAASKPISDIYTVEPSKREAQGRCITNVKVVFVGPEFNNLYEHKFEKKQCSAEINLLTSGIVENNYIIVSTDSRAGIAAGFVTRISSSAIAVLLDRNLNIKYQGKCFHLDTYDTNITQTFNMTSVALLLEDTPRAAHLRSIIIDKMTPSFSSKLPSVVAKRGAPILRRLNHVQQKAVLKALCAKDFFLIKGMPGTGKTATIVALVQLLIELNKTVLITSHTHSAIDNICLRLQKYGVSFLRLGSEDRMDKNITSQSETTLTKGCTTPEQLQDIYNSFKVVAVTCLGSSHSLLSQRSFDFCIVDESTQVLQTSVIRPLAAAKIFVLIGDPDQLAPVVKNRKACEAGMTETLFERLSTISTDGIISLNLSYRMNKVITSLANTLTYEGQLQGANELVANNTLVIPDFEKIKSLYKDHSWLLKAVDTSLEASVKFIDTGPVWQFSQTVGMFDSMLLDNLNNDNCVNIHEIAIAVMLVDGLIKGGVPSTHIGVIATYRAQVDQISRLLCSTNVDVSTIDQFQGRDKNVIIYSCTKSKDMTKTSSEVQKFELLEDKRRLTVAVTRAKQKLLMIGDASTLQNYSTFSVILAALQNENIIPFGSNWTILDDIKFK